MPRSCCAHSRPAASESGQERSGWTWWRRDAGGRGARGPGEFVKLTECGCPCADGSTAGSGGSASSSSRGRAWCAAICARAFWLVVAGSRLIRSLSGAGRGARGVSTWLMRSARSARSHALALQGPALGEARASSPSQSLAAGEARPVSSRGVRLPCLSAIARTPTLGLSPLFPTRAATRKGHHPASPSPSPRHLPQEIWLI